jgi:hypothetical protein
MISKPRRNKNELDHRNERRERRARPTSTTAFVRSGVMSGTSRIENLPAREDDDDDEDDNVCVDQTLREDETADFKPPLPHRTRTDRARETDREQTGSTTRP